MRARPLRRRRVAALRSTSRSSARSPTRTASTRPGPASCSRSSTASATSGPSPRALRSSRRSTSAATRRTAHELVAVGHAHLDTAWLWPLAETYRKAIRTFTTQARYLRRVPRLPLRLLAGAAVRVDRGDRARSCGPRSAALVDAGGWVPVGGTWIEPDCNIPSGESLAAAVPARPAVLRAASSAGAAREFWNPDVFGYNGQLPQIMREGGVARFLTQKLSWNRFNRPEHHTFVWQGIDGSEVLGALPARRHVHERRHGRGAAEERAGLQGPRALADLDARLRLRRRRRRADARDDRDDAPRSRPAGLAADDGCAAPTEFFEALEAEPGERPTILGELYFEYHRGTYTTQARTKRGNRRAEIALHDAEFLATVARRRLPARRSSTGCGSSCSCSSSTTSSRARRSGSSTRTPSATWPRSRPARTRSRRRRSRLSAAAR